MTEPDAESRPAPDASDPPLLSVIIPVYNEADRLGPCLDQVLAYLDGQDYLSEILVVENGSVDDTWAILQQRVGDDPRVHALRSGERGKGKAIVAGMLAAKGRFRFMCDVDLSMPIEQVDRFLPPHADDGTVAIGNREHRHSDNRTPWSRRLIGRLFNLAVRVIALPGLRDTQCGFKCFPAAAAEAVFSRVTRHGLAFDVEALVIAKAQGFEVREVAITWVFDAHSRVRLIRDSLRMLWDLCVIRTNRWRGRYRA